ncbi:ArsR/SmtB family transcription factor [Parvularcula maris]|uniref:Metalloregulator ArsR/SmtB family transcription factor n=1 Tax=Parvularcula maris TaxID=2965077 RepID=A0A9X2L907_9PROT|nr:metalloregulator ArsR/SmtB family transcription factor [Parvularcula maris]MCQ8184432.1 metalloregulator ArsR/SmtB family transcription factor [Parvularcula maris]
MSASHLQRRAPRRRIVQFDVSLEQLRAAGEDTRLRILYLLSHGDLTVTELTVCLDQLQPRVSRHLRILVDAGLIVPHQEGAWRFYRLAKEAASWLPGLLERLEGAAVTAAAKALAKVRADRAERAAAYFAQNAEQWDALRRLHTDDRLIEEAMLELAPSKIGRFVDLGTGTGRMLVLFADRYGEGIGYDLSPEMLAVARVRLEEAGVRNASVRRQDILDVAGIDDMVEGADLVCIHHVLHFLGEPGVAVQAAARKLAPGGTLLIADFAHHEHTELQEAFAHRRLGFEDQEIADYAQDAGVFVDRDVDLPPETSDGLVAKIWRLNKPFEPHSDQPLRGASLV